MCEAIRAKTAERRANIAAQHIRSGRPSTRCFDSCFEMGDGDEVVAILRERAKTDTKLADNIGKYLVPQA